MLARGEDPEEECQHRTSFILRCWPGSDRQVRALLDGSGRTVLAQDSFDRAADILFSWRVLEWREDGSALTFSRQPFGGGGIILFGGYASLWAYDLRSGTVPPSCLTHPVAIRLRLNHSPPAVPGCPTIATGSSV